MANRSMTDIAYEFLSKRKRSVEFLKLWNEVNDVLKFPENQIRTKRAQLYSELMIDNRFASLEDNKWDLRNRRKFNEVYIDPDAIVLDDDDENEDIEEDEIEEED
ncbi:MAG: DNA-directed RNA polymerase subunit delta [Erysipelotrichaceae bacterium]|nr:DNA-directed RNA polymerase subunit delta [Erysipelotrichaceae bacterium]